MFEINPCAQQPILPTVPALSNTELECSRFLSDVLSDQHTTCVLDVRPSNNWQEALHENNSIYVGSFMS